MNKITEEFHNNKDFVDTIIFHMIGSWICFTLEGDIFDEYVCE